MGKIDVFLSYEHSMKSVVDHICAALEQDGIRCWYAPRDVMGDYATSIMNAIDEARVFVVVLNNAASESVHVLNEVENAYKRIVEKNGDLTILPFRLNNEDLSKAMEYYINRLHWIDAASQGVDNAVAELKSKIKAILSPRSDASGAKRARTANPYFKDGDKKEKHRLAVQRELLKSFDAELYDKIAAETDTLTVLDLGSADGSFVMDRLGRRENLGALLGIDFDQSCVDAANSAYGSDKIAFRQGDLESDAVEDVIRAFLDEKGIAGFNVINLSMVLLHLQNPLKLLRTARKFALKNAVIVVKDIDDGFNVAYPDPEGYFEKATEMCADSPFSGFRESGRQIPHLLHKTGFRDAKLVKCGVNTVGMDYDERQALFDTYFSIVKMDFDRLAEEVPDNKQYRDYRDWLAEHYADMEDAFLEEDFFFSLGFMLFTARR